MRASTTTRSKPETKQTKQQKRETPDTLASPLTAIVNKVIIQSSSCLKLHSTCDGLERSLDVSLTIEEEASAWLREAAVERGPASLVLGWRGNGSYQLKLARSSSGYNLAGWAEVQLRRGTNEGHCDGGIRCEISILRQGWTDVFGFAIGFVNHWQAAQATCSTSQSRHLATLGIDSQPPGPELGRLRVTPANHWAAPPILPSDRSLWPPGPSG